MQIHSSEADKIKAMFSKVAARYDHANDILSAGIHHLWRQQLVRLSKAKPGDKVLDCATGTGDLAIAFKKVVGAQGTVVGTDFCKEMLDFAPGKAAGHNLKIEFAVCIVRCKCFQNTKIFCRDFNAKSFRQG